MVRSRPQLIPLVSRLAREAVGAFGFRRLLTPRRWPTVDGDPPRMLEQDRKRAGWSVRQAAWRVRSASTYSAWRLVESPSTGVSVLGCTNSSWSIAFATSSGSNGLVITASAPLRGNVGAPSSA